MGASKKRSLAKVDNEGEVRTYPSRNHPEDRYTQTPDVRIKRVIPASMLLWGHEGWRSTDVVRHKQWLPRRLQKGPRVARTVYVESDECWHRLDLFSPTGWLIENNGRTIITESNMAVYIKEYVAQLHITVDNILLV